MKKIFVLLWVSVVLAQDVLVIKDSKIQQLSVKELKELIDGGTAPPPVSPAPAPVYEITPTFHPTQGGPIPTTALPALPRPEGWEDPNTFSPKRTITLNPSAPLQPALNALVSGDQLVLDGGSWAGNFVIPPRLDSGWVWVVGKNNAKLLSPNSNAALTILANRVAVKNLEVSVVDGVLGNFGLISVGPTSPTSYTSIPLHTHLSNLNIHGTPSCGCKRGLELNSSFTTLINSSITDIHVVGQDTQAIYTSNGPGPFRILNNLLEAAGENIMFGGDDPSLRWAIMPSAVNREGATFPQPFLFPAGAWFMFQSGGRTSEATWVQLKTSDQGVVTFVKPMEVDPDLALAFTQVIPSDIIISNNILRKPLSWKIGHSSYAGTPWTVKNLFELKCAQRVLLDSNRLEGSWVHGQTGPSIVLKTANQGGNGAACSTRDITISNNLVLETDNGVAIQGRESYSRPLHQPAAAERIRFESNIFGPSGRAISIFSQPKDVAFVQNTIFAKNNLMVFEPSHGVIKGLEFTKNLLERPNYGVWFPGGDNQEGLTSLQRATAGWPLVWEGNVILNSSAVLDQKRSDAQLAAYYKSPILPGRLTLDSLLYSHYFLNQYGAKFK